ncbi:hypothetical protein [Microbispora bryophytorum]
MTVRIAGRTTGRIAGRTTGRTTGERAAPVPDGRAGGGPPAAVQET